MADFKERRFSIDPGKGKKMDGCPYSIFEDGRDVQEYIIPPKGYRFKSFRFDPDASNQIYDGRLIAEYEKEPFNDILKSNLWKLILALGIIAIITVVVMLALNVFNKPNTDKPFKTTEPTVVVKDTANKKTEIIQSTETKDTTTLPSDTMKPAEKDDEVIIDLNAKKHTVKKEEPQPVADDPNVKFKQEFWTLIHERTIKMDPYDNLYKENKNKVEGEEYEYLRLTILKDFSSFKEWSSKLQKIPASDMESINTVNDLKSKLKEIP